MDTNGLLIEEDNASVMTEHSFFSLFIIACIFVLLFLR